MRIRSAHAGLLGAVMLTLMLGMPLAQAGTSNESSGQDMTNNNQSEINDAWLDGKLEASLLFNEYLNSFDIDTEVNNGVAYLTGVVESDIDRDLAGEIAESINGINKVENELVVDRAKAQEGGNSPAAKEREGFKQSVMNATLTARVKSKLLLNSNTSGLAINVDSRDGVVTLTGEVDSAQEKDLALKIAGNTEGANTVNDKLMVGSEEEEA